MHKLLGVLHTPVEVSACTKASTLASGWFNRLSHLIRIHRIPPTVLNHDSGATATLTFSFMRPPKTPFWHTIALSPGSRRFTKAASMPADPGADSGIVSSFLV